MLGCGARRAPAIGRLLAESTKCLSHLLISVQLANIGSTKTDSHTTAYKRSSLDHRSLAELQQCAGVVRMHVGVVEPASRALPLPSSSIRPAPGVASCNTLSRLPTLTMASPRTATPPFSMSGCVPLWGVERRATFGGAASIQDCHQPSPSNIASIDL